MDNRTGRWFFFQSADVNFLRFAQGEDGGSLCPIPVLSSRKCKDQKEHGMQYSFAESKAWSGVHACITPLPPVYSLRTYFDTTALASTAPRERWSEVVDGVQQLLRRRAPGPERAVPQRPGRTARRPRATRRGDGGFRVVRVEGEGRRNWERGHQATERECKRRTLFGALEPDAIKSGHVRVTVHRGNSGPMGQVYLGRETPLDFVTFQKHWHCDPSRTLQTASDPRHSTLWAGPLQNFVVGFCVHVGGAPLDQVLKTSIIFHLCTRYGSTYRLRRYVDP